MVSKVAVITGASRGIGRALAEKFAKSGYNLALCCHHNTTALEEVSQYAREAGVSCLTFTGDMGDPVQAEQFFKQIRNTYPHIDILINNAGISQVGLLQDTTPEQWDRILRTNLSSAFYCSSQAIRQMISRKQGKILNISSVWGCVGASTEVAYSATKGGLNAFTKALAKELAPSNIQVNAIACGFIDTEMNRFLTPEDRDAIFQEIPAGRPGTPEEVADFAWHLTQDKGYLTGQVIKLDGGWI